MNHRLTLSCVFFIVLFGLMSTATPRHPEASPALPLSEVAPSQLDVTIKSAYLIDTIDITMRTGPGIDYKIIAMLRLGQKVEILEEQADWSRIRTAAGREGWVSNRFIGREIPGRILYEELKARHERLLAEYAALEEEVSRLNEQNGELQEKLDSGVIVSKERLNLLLEENRRLKSMTDNGFLSWFLAGAGVLLAGFLIGRLAGRDKRRHYFK